MEEEVVLRSTVRQRTMGVAYRYVECEQHWLAGVGGHRRFTFTNQWSQRATQIISQGAGNVGGGWSLLYKKEQEKQTFRNLNKQFCFHFRTLYCKSPHNPWAKPNAQKQQDIDHLNMRFSQYLIYWPAAFSDLWSPITEATFRLFSRIDQWSQEKKSIEGFWAVISMYVFNMFHQVSRGAGTASYRRPQKWSWAAS